MKIKKFLALAVVALCATVATTSCKEDKLDLYSGCKAGLFIQQVNTTDIYGNPISFRKEQTFSFADYDDKTQEFTLGFDVKLCGPVSNVDRPFVIKVIADSTTAVEGQDFDISMNDYVLKAGKAAATVKIRLIRNPSLRQKMVKVMFRLEPNEHFELPIGNYKNSSGWNVDGPIYNASEYWFSFGEQYKQPSYWSFGSSWYGAFSVAKYLALNKVMSWTVNDWSKAGQTGEKIGYGRLEYATAALQKYLQKLADEGTPLIDDDGKSYVQLAGSYLVNYSAYNK